MSNKSRHILTCHLSPCQRYRYLLRVALLSENPQSPFLTVILKNPSTADANHGDPTTGKVEAWARHHGYSGLTYLNLFALRSPYPKTINRVRYAEAVGKDNDRSIQTELADAQTIVIAWGNPNGIELDRYRQRIAEVTALLRNSKKIIHTVGNHTQLGHPRHGLQWRKDMAISRWTDWEIVPTPHTIP